MLYASSPPLPELPPGITVAVLRRVWNATPAGQKHQRATLLDSIITVTTGGHTTAKPLRELTLPEVEAAIGAVTPRFVVRYYQPGKLGVQLNTFVERDDADAFAAGKKLYGEPAKVEPIDAEGR